jgi:hypothetical protein
MRVRTGFVSNSSSTSFLIISKGEMTEERFLSLVGVRNGTAMGDVFLHLYQALLSSQWGAVDFGRPGAPGPEVAVASWGKAHVTDRMMERIRDAHKNGDLVIYGELSTDEDSVETFFCCESFELAGDGLYLNALEATW